MKKLAVVAFGGNALLRSGQKGTINEQESNVLETCKHLIALVKKDYNLVIGHGNGPQVGNVLLQHDAGEKIYGIPKQPMDICVSETQGSIGYMIEKQFHNVLVEENIDKNILSFITQVIVDKKDDAFNNPTKPVGPYYTKDEADTLEVDKKWKFQEDARGRGWRRVVPSPKPVSINNINIIEKLAKEGNIVVTVGGGGIPAIVNENNMIEGIEAVIDKDLASSQLASQIGADEFYILTDVAKVYLNFNTPDEKSLDVISVSEAKKYLDEKHFAEGSMAPKVRAAIQFIENGGSKCVITEAAELGKENAGTQIIKD